MRIAKPADLPDSLDARFARISDRLASIDCDVPDAALGALVEACLVSDFVLNELARDPAPLLERAADPTPLSAGALDAGLDLDGCDEPEAMGRLRRFRNREMARIAWRDLEGLDDLETSLANLSVLADALIRAAHEHCMSRLAPRFGRPVDEKGRAAGLIVLAMGKLGGRELNFSSDVDLVFLNPDEVAFDGGAATSAGDYFPRLAQLLIRMLDQTTPDGFVFRVDTRLRPFGASGPLVIGLSAFESYLISHARDWERYAYVKARLVTGRDYESEVFDQILSPFVYRRYLDYGVFASLRAMKSLIRKEVARKEMIGNVKLGPGGIREIEFIVQAIQLVRGGQTPALRSSSLLAVLPKLSAGKELGPDAVGALSAAYAFLRTLENRLQAMNDRQTHILPSGPEERARLAYAMGENDWAALESRVERHRRAVEEQFERIAKETDREEEAPGAETFAAGFSSGRTADAVRGTAIESDESAIARLEALRRSGRYARMDEQSRQRLLAVLSRTMPLLARYASPAVVLERALEVFDAICRRSAYLALLDENPHALENLLKLMDRGGLLARQLADQPILLDELLDQRVFEAQPNREEFERLLELKLHGAAGAGVESALDAMRAFHGTAIFRVAVADTLGKLPLMKVSDRLTDVAELVVGLALELAMGESQRKYGTPMCGPDSSRREAHFAVIAYGKLAGLELGYGSDLDLVFVHDSAGERQETEADDATDNSVFFARLAQRLIHFLSIQTTAGRLYEVDARLRPGGESGPLVTGLERFERYQREEAWVWEHQALLRSRAIAGDPGLRETLERVRFDVLRRHVDREHLRERIVEMRRRMRDELSKAGPGQFDLKQGEGGLADIEFIVDYLVLGNAERHPELVEHPDNIRQIEALEKAGLVDDGRARGLISAYLELRQRAHDLALASGGRVVDSDEFGDVRRFVGEVWKDVLA